MNERFERFSTLLRQIFELDKSDLDFGIYRVMNLRREKIENFLSHRLPDLVRETLKPFAENNKDELRSRMSEIQKTASEFGMDLATLPENNSMVQKYRALQKQMIEGSDIAALETDVYSSLHSFFNRYYDDGDFISKRRYKEGVYAIPYEGEEVKLYWANQDQYYIKTSENFKDYTFAFDNISVHFRLVEGTTEQNNNKEDKDSKRQFMLFNENEEKYPGIHTFEYNEVTSEIIIRFVYDIPEDKKKKYGEENYDNITKWIFSLRRAELNQLIAPISTGKAKETTTLLEKHLKSYNAKNTFDYFIHKDLNKFLRRELDFYIKSEIMHIEDLDTEKEIMVDTYLAKIKVIKRVGIIIIDFLSQIEEFQKKLWNKKKFIVETNWCISLDRIDEAFWQDIISNNNQIDEWISQFSIEQTNNWSNPPTLEFLRQNNNLLIDTKHFSKTFKYSLLESIIAIETETSGILIHGENYQALNLLSNRYKNKIQTIYIDPPYNTVYSEIPYKNNYKHSSWLSLLNNTMPLLPSLWTNDFSFGLSIDDYEFINLAQLVDYNFPSYERSVVVVNHHPQGAGGRLSRTHEYYMLLSDPSSPAYLGEPVEDYQEDRNYMRSGTAKNNYRYGRWNSFYALLVDQKTKKIVDVEDPVPLDQSYPTEPTSEGYTRVYPINSKGEERVWRSSYKTGRKRAKNGELFISTGGTIYQSIDHESKREVLFSNWTDSKFNAGTQGANLLKDMGLGGNFDYPKSINTLETGLWAQTFGRDNGIILDFFAGSGTTAHAVINLNRKFGGCRKFILIEMGEYFNTTTKPRVLKAAYSANWKDGVPENNKSGKSQLIKYIRLESYEDALTNIKLNDNSDQMYDLLGEEYMIHYMFDLESRSSLLNMDSFTDPFSYTMKITEKNESKEREIDIVETFNYLIGLNVSSYSNMYYYQAKSADSPSYMGAVDLISDIDGQYVFQHLVGTLYDGSRVLVIWRTVTDNILESNAALDSYFLRYRKNHEDRKFDYIYVNGDNNIGNLIKNTENTKVFVTEIEFKNKMFEEA